MDVLGSASLPNLMAGAYACGEQGPHEWNSVAVVEARSRRR